VPPPELAFRRQKAVLWPVESVDEVNEPTFGTPREIEVRYVPRTRTVQGPQGG
jgi:hypothetical protein